MPTSTGLSATSRTLVVVGIVLAVLVFLIDRIFGIDRAFRMSHNR